MSEANADWKVFRDGGTTDTAYIRESGSEGFGDKEIAVLYSLPNEDRANLIAAAPEMLETLEETAALLRVVTRIEIRNITGIYGTGMVSLRDKVEVILRKAKGE